MAILRNIAIFSLTLLMGCATSTLKDTQADANFFLHRWNPGKKAEPIPFYEGKISETEYKEFVKTGNLPGIAHHGCFVAVYAPKEGRALASERLVEPKAMNRVCL